MRKIRDLKLFIILLILILLISCGYLSFCKVPYALTTKSYVIQDSTLPEEFKNFKVGYFSDLDLNEDKDIDRLDQVVNQINKEEFDLILFGGDVYDSQVFNKDLVIEKLKGIYAKYGKFAVMGEKDYISASDVKSILQLSGFEVLSNEIRTIYYNNSSIQLLGLESNDNLDSLVSENSTNTYQIALVHQPDFFINSINKKINLQISGHSHGGYIYFPFYGALFKPEGAITYNHGKYQSDTSTLVVSNGIGMESNQSARFLCTPDIVKITLDK